LRLVRGRRSGPLKPSEPLRSDRNIEVAQGLVQAGALVSALLAPTDDQRTRLLEIAGKCPVHRILTEDNIMIEELINEEMTLP